MLFNKSLPIASELTDLNLLERSFLVELSCEIKFLSERSKTSEPESSSLPK